MNLKERMESLKAMAGQKVSDARQKVKETWENHKAEVFAYGALGLTFIGCAGVAAYQISENKKLNQEIKDKYGEHVIHWSVLGGTAPKRRADLKIWEEGERKERFDKMKAFARELDVPDGEYYCIDKAYGPDGKIVTEITQTCGQFIHGEWF